ncbi:hypothetical protein BH10PSE17_BH10PSE17_31110 [soil metagenome]
MAWKSWLSIVSLAVLSLGGCERADTADAAPVAAAAPVSAPESVARQLADTRFLAVARMLGSRTVQAPEPELERHGDDLEFGYVDPASAKRIIVTVDGGGAVSSKVLGP